MKCVLNILLNFILIITVNGQSNHRKFHNQLEKVPQNIFECIDALDKILCDSAKSQCKLVKSEIDLENFNSRYTKEIQDLWFLQTFASPLTRYFYLHNVTVPQDMTYLVFSSYSKKLNSQPVDIYMDLWRYYDKSKIIPHPSKPVNRFQIGDTLRLSDIRNKYIFKNCIMKGFFLYAVVAEKDTSINYIKICVCYIIKCSGTKTKSIESHEFRNKKYVKGTCIWEEATSWRRDGESFGIDVN